MIFERIGRIFAPSRPPCIGNDPLCPCQDGDNCHYRDIPGSKGWLIPVSEPEQKQEVKGRSMVGYSRRGFLGMLGLATIAIEPVYAVGADILANGTVWRNHFSDGSMRDVFLRDAIEIKYSAGRGDEILPYSHIVWPIRSRQWEFGGHVDGPVELIHPLLPLPGDTLTRMATWEPKR